MTNSVSNNMLVAVKFPRERGKKVNISRFLSKFKKFKPSVLVEIPDEKAEHVLKVLSRNNCEVKILKPALVDVEEKIVDDILDLVRKIKAGKEEPKALGRFAIEKIKIFSLENLSNEVGDLLHLCIEFEDNPSILILNEIERRGKELG